MSLHLIVGDICQGKLHVSLFQGTITVVSNFDIDIFDIVSYVSSIDSKLGAAHHQQTQDMCLSFR